MATEEKKTGKKTDAQTNRVTYQLDSDYNPDLSKLERLSKPAYVRPLSLPAGAIITALIEGASENEVGTAKKKRLNQSLQLKVVGSNMKAFPTGMQFSFPMNTVLEGALGEGLPVLMKHKGKQITLKVLESRTSPNFGKTYFNCEVFLGK